jgi:hypothetical protein
MLKKDREEKLGNGGIKYFGNKLCIVTRKTNKMSHKKIMDLETYTQAGMKHASKDEVISLDHVRDNQHELNCQVSMILKIFRVGSTWGHGDRARGNMLCSSEMICNMYILFKDHKGWHWGLGTDPPGRPIASGNGGQNIHMSELTSEIIESVVTAYKGGVEIISTEDMLAKWDALNQMNKDWSPGAWWDGFEEDDLVTCGTCIGEDDSGELCTCQNDDQTEGWKIPQDDHQNVPEGWIDSSSPDDENLVQGTGNDGDPGMSTSRDFVPEREVTGHLDESLADNDNITKGQGVDNNIKKSYKKSIYATKKNNKTNKNKLSKSKFTVGGPDDQGKKVSGHMSQPSPVLSPDDSSNKNCETIPVGGMANSIGGVRDTITTTEGWKTDGPACNTIPEGRKPNRIEDFIQRKKSGEITGQKMRITVKCMKERRRRKWERNYNWLERDLDRLIDSVEANPEDLQDYSLPMVLVGSDVASLYPTLDADKVAELVYNAVIKSDIKWTNLDYIEATRYIVLNWTEEQCSQSKLRRILPKRRSNRGTRPGVRGTGPSGPSTGDQEQWRWNPNLKLKEAEKREIVARVI